MGGASSRIGFADLFVLAGVTLLALPFVAMSMGRTHDTSSRVVCYSNLRQIGFAIQAYAADNHGSFPRTNWHPLANPNPVPTAYTGVNAADPFAADGPADNDVTAALFLTLKKTAGTASDIFICPMDTRATPLPAIPATRSNWPGRQNLSYSYQNPYLSQAARKAGLKLNFMLGSDFALAADMNPGGAALTQLSPESSANQMRLGNSPIHLGEGQCVLYADGHVEFQVSPFCGAVRPAKGGGLFRDNIYTAGGPNTLGAAGPTPVVLAAPQDQFDTVLLPVAPEGPVAPLPAEKGLSILGIVGVSAIVIALVAGGVLRARRRRRRSRTPVTPLAANTGPHVT